MLHISPVQVRFLVYSHVRWVYSVHMSCIQELVVHRDQNSESVHQWILVQHTLHRSWTPHTQQTGMSLFTVRALETAVDGVSAYWPGVEDLSDTLLLRRGRSSSSLKLLSWLGSKSSSAAMLSISRLTAPLEGYKSTQRFYSTNYVFKVNCMKRICLYSKNRDDNN